MEGRGRAMKIAHSDKVWWAIGRRGRNGFRIRRLVKGRLAARYEKEPGEIYRQVSVTLKEAAR
jgi:hypothetical protein